MGNFTGQLNINEIFASLYNMIINIHVFSDNIADTESELVNMSRVEGSLYGDTKLYISTEILGSAPWGNDAEAVNLLALHRPPAPDVQAIELNQFRQISLTVDDYLSKRSFTGEGSFASFNSVMLGWIGETKRIYDSKLFNSFIGTHYAENITQTINVSLPQNDDPERQARLQAQTIARELADLYVELADAGRDFNDYGNYRSFSKEDLVVVWNSEYVNSITKMDLPTIFNKEGLIDGFKHSLPAKYFGTILTEGATLPGSSANLTVRTLVEKDYNTVPRSNRNYVKSLHIFPGDLIPAGQAYLANEAYTEDSTVICKIYHKRSVPFMSAFEVGTSFFNSKSLTDNRYLTWGYNTLEHLANYPFITVKAVPA